MTYYEPPEWAIPTRAELAREEYEDWLADTYEERFREFCDRTGTDPENVGSAVAYEREFNEEQP